MIRSNLYTIAIAAPADVSRYHPSHCENGVAVAAKVERIAVWNDYVVGYTVASPMSELADIERVGYFILNTRTDEALLGLSETDWDAALARMGIPRAKLKLIDPARL